MPIETTFQPQLAQKKPLTSHRVAKKITRREKYTQAR